MPCYHPLNAWRGRDIGKNGKRLLVFQQSKAFAPLAHDTLKLPCQRCIGCRLEYSRQWAMRIHHEASLYQANSFITLTYDDEHLPYGGSLNLRHHTLFMKKLRKSLGPTRFFHAGEYGEQLARPHYHYCLFGRDFPDQKLFKTVNDIPIYTSQKLSDIWGQGFVTVGEVTFESAAYCARYVTKKMYGEKAENHYLAHDRETGELLPDENGCSFYLRPEYATMSRGGKNGGGIASAWLKKYPTSVYPDDYVVIRGIKMKPPKYYDNQKKLAEPEKFKQITAARIAHALKHSSDSTPERLRVREKVQEAKFKQLPRTLERDSL